MNVQKIPFESPHAHEHFAESLRETGFAVLTNHPIPAQMILDVYGEWIDFFNSEEKYKYTFDPKLQSGYFPFRSENAKGYSAKDLKEFYHLYSWGELPAGMSDHTWHLFRMINGLAAELLQWIEEACPAEVKNRFSMPLRSMSQDSRETLLRVLHYPPLSGREEEGAIRAAAHEDINLITLLPAATAPGLEVLDLRGNWHQVPCNPGDLVINVGDMLQLASDGFYKSTTHRVVNPPGVDAQIPRYSMPLFLHARSDVRLSEKHTAGTYLQERLKEIGLK